MRGLLQAGNTFPVDQRAPLEVQLVRLDVGVVTSLAPPQRQSKLVDDRPRDLILNGEDVLQFAMNRSDQRGVSPQLESVGH